MPRRGQDEVMADSDKYDKALLRLQQELVSMQQWVRDEGKRVVIVVEGRDAAGKGGVIKRITEHLNPRWCRIAALPAPSDREKTEWYFQRYIAHLPAGGEIVLFDRSWYNRAGVERVMGFCTEEEYHRFFRQCPAFERMLIDDGIILVKYWFSVSDQKTGAKVQRPSQRSPQALEAQRHGSGGPQTLGPVLQGKGRDVRSLRPAGLALVRSRGRRQEARPAQLHRPSPVDDPLRAAASSPSPGSWPKRAPVGNYRRPPRDRYRYVPDYVATIN